MYGYIYLTTNTVNGKMYIGQHVSNVFEPHKYIGSGVHLRNAIKRYGRTAFTNELIDEAKDQLELDAKEILHIAEYRKRYGNHFIYNIADGGGSNAVNLNTEAIQSRVRRTLIRRYGKLGAQMHTAKARARMHRTKVELYGNECAPMNTETAINKRNNTKMDRYGSKAGRLNTPELEASIHAILVNKYGPDYPHLHTPEARAKCVATTISRYGSLCGHMHTPEMKRKAKEAQIAKYGNLSLLLNSPEARRKQQETSGTHVLVTFTDGTKKRYPSARAVTYDLGISHIVVLRIMRNETIPRKHTLNKYHITSIEPCD